MNVEVIAAGAPLAPVAVDDLVGPVAPLWPARITWLDGAAHIALAFDLHVNLSPDFDVSEVAKRLGGGGHRQASGFREPMGQRTVGEQ